MLSAVVLCPLMEAAHVSIYSTAPPVPREDLRQQGSLSTDTPQILVTVPEPGGALPRALASFNQHKGWVRGGCALLAKAELPWCPLVGSAGKDRFVTRGLWPHPSGLSPNVDCRQQPLHLCSTSLLR